MKRRDDGIPRRCDVSLDTPAEAAIRGAVAEVEKAGAHPLLTDAVILLDQARNKVADFVEGVNADAAADVQPARHARRSSPAV